MRFSAHLEQIIYGQRLWIIKPHYLQYTTVLHPGAGKRGIRGRGGPIKTFQKDYICAVLSFLKAFHSFGVAGNKKSSVNILKVPNQG